MMKPGILTALGTLVLFSLFTGKFARCQGQAYRAPWITYPTASVTNYGVYHFRKVFQLQELPEELVAHISADNRYKLYVNGAEVCYGPAKGDLSTYKYDIIDIGPHLVEGENVIAALVYNAGKDKPMALLSAQTAFFVKFEAEQFQDLNTNGSWKTYRNEAYTPISYQEMLFTERWFYGYYACGPGDDVNASLYPWGWETESFDDSNWQQAEMLEFDGNPPWKLVPRNIPFMDAHKVWPKAMRSAEGVSVPDEFVKGSGAIEVPSNSEATLLLDYEVLTMGYPELSTSGGTGASIMVKYAEALYEGVNLKAHRDSVEGKIMYGVWDVFRPDGETRTFRPLWKRCFRYVQLNIRTGDEPLQLNHHFNEYSGYPYPNMATFRSDDEKLNEIFDICLRTLQMCSGETYYDTPFYEQLSYGGDNRPIGMNSMYNSTDDQLFREVMRLYPQSVNKETGLFKSAYPSRFDFDMGSWSLAWIQSLRDYYFMRGDRAFVSQFVSDIEGVLSYYRRHMDEELGVLGPVNSQNFMDWSIGKGSIPRKNEAGDIDHSILLTLYYAHSLDCVVELYRELGMESEASSHEQMANDIKSSVKQHFWDDEMQLFTDYPDSKVFSQHTNIMAILCDVIPDEEQTALLEDILTRKDFTEYASSYFSFYLFKAMQKTGMQDRFLDHLGFWYQFLDRGHSTAGETGFASHDRSDCHAWAAHPAYYMLSLAAGIMPAEIGFKRVIIEPHPGRLTKIDATMPHPQGELKVSYKVRSNKIIGEVVLPPGLSGTFIYKDQEINLVAGTNVIK